MLFRHTRQTPDPILHLKILAVLGACALLSFFAIAILLSFPGPRPQPRLTPRAPYSLSPTSTPLGELGSRCGGTARLPCRPGLQCSHDPAVQESEGVCEQPKEAARQVGYRGLRQLGEACGSDAPFCAIGLYCKRLDSQDRACAVFDAGAPRVVSIKVDGATPKDGMYYIASDVPVKLIARVANAESVNMKLDVKDAWAGASLLLKPTKRESSDTYSSMLTMKQGVEGDISIVVTSQKGETAYMVIRVAAKDSTF